MIREAENGKKKAGESVGAESPGEVIPEPEDPGERAADGDTETGEYAEADAGDMECLRRYDVIPAEQEILLRGNWILVWEDCILDVSKTGGAVAISGEGLERLRSIRVFPAAVMTVENKTSFVVAHRLSTVRNADKIIVLGRGRLIEEGTHDELLSLKGYYYNTLKSQGQN